MTSRILNGWRIDKEDFDFLYALEGEDLVMQLCGSYQEVSLDPRSLLRVENQGPVGSCQGQSISSGCEWLYILATGDSSLQLSRSYGYYRSQKIDGLLGRDAGSTIQAGIKVAMEFGIPEESEWKYANRYSPNPPKPWDEMDKLGAKYKIAKAIRLTTYEAIRTFLGAGVGMVHLGIPWNSSVDKALVTSFNPNGGGGHSIGLYSLSDRKDSQGRPFVWMMNSWDKTWGNAGWAEWSPDAVSAMLKARFAVFVGISEMPNVKPREWKLDDIKKQVKWWVSP